MHVRKLMTGGPITVGSDTPVVEARQLMVKERIRHLLVVEDGRLLGIVTDRDTPAPRRCAARRRRR